MTQSWVLAEAPSQDFVVEGPSPFCRVFSVPMVHWEVFSKFVESEVYQGDLHGSE
jgi:hypothetical protein